MYNLVHYNTETTLYFQQLYGRTDFIFLNYQMRKQKHIMLNYVLGIIYPGNLKLHSSLLVLFKESTFKITSLSLTTL